MQLHDLSHFCLYSILTLNCIYLTETISIQSGAKVGLQLFVGKTIQ